MQQLEDDYRKLDAALGRSPGTVSGADEIRGSLKGLAGASRTNARNWSRLSNQQAMKLAATTSRY